MPMKILLADDHNLLAEAVGNMLNALPGNEAITTDSYDGILSLLAEHSDVDIVLLDLKMPGMVGLASVKSVIEKSAPAKVVLFTGMVDRHFLHSALELGCKGLIPKTMPLQSLNSVLQLIMSGQTFVPMDAGTTGHDKSGPDPALPKRNSLCCVLPPTV